MAFQVRIPSLGESVTEGTIVRWAKENGEAIAVDDVLLELETDKANMEIPSDHAGVVKILKPAGSTVQVGELVAEIEDGAAAKAIPPAAPAPAAAAPSPPSEARPASKPAPAPTPSTPPPAPGPAARHLLAEKGIDAAAIAGTGKRGQVTKADVLARAAAPAPAVAGAPGGRRPERLSGSEGGAPPVPPHPATAEPRSERVVPMTRIRKRIAERLVAAQHTAAILTTFNEIDMSAVMDLRARYKERFEKKHGIGLGFMSLFSVACIAALREIPAVNAEIRGDDVVYKDFVHLGVAVGTERGLVVPVVRNADLLSMAGLEREIARLAGLARDGKLLPDDLAGGTFTISNGGVYGSLLSTPILNPPQSGILGMHKIEKRAVVIADQVVVRPMMYVALSYDHRLVDGEQAVTFLVRVKERLEDPARLVLDV
ncbi:MAG TPA: 2-oxoglutarate dehydrogenase complex dihydrolipoyllysine-residue succinyltransferase [Candidatus Eisenbacteria bacterium]|nr:2-oxoglutarate dehydrogenase complex dihydrolipoyllysine-residue succinyltransferase [Candidatus Eisenbacteria bacterium]